MTNLLQSGIQWLNGTLKASAAVDVTYARGADTVDLMASRGSTRAEVSDGEGNMTLKTVIDDWIIDAADLILAGELTEPDDGDEIRLTVGETEYVYTVFPIAGEPCFRPSDAYGTRLRIHTKLSSQT